MRINIVTGSYPPDICGCGDYTAKLHREFQLQGINVNLFVRRDWKLHRLFGYVRAIRRSGATLVNVQYPTESYGYSIVPMLICGLLGRGKTVVTLHEFSSKSLPGKIAIYLFFIFAGWVVFTSDFERDTACRVASWLKSRSSVIPIGSNIPVQEAREPDADVAYFGLIRPMKGLENFLAVVSEVKGKFDMKVRAIGQIVPKYGQYADRMIEQLRAAGVDVILNAGPEEVSSLLSRTKIALLPFPDGMSQRRGSALAAMGNGALVVTTASSFEPDRYKGICVASAAGRSLEEALLHTLEHFDEYMMVREAGRRYAQSVTWSAVGLAYRELFERLIKGQRMGA